MPPEPSVTSASEAEANQYLDVLKDAMSVHTYFPQQNARTVSKCFATWKTETKRSSLNGIGAGSLHWPDSQSATSVSDANGSRIRNCARFTR
jgi:hypothetical protein